MASVEPLLRVRLVPLIDAAVRANYEVGLFEGKRRARDLGITPLPGPGGTRPSQ